MLTFPCPGVKNALNRLCGLFLLFLRSGLCSALRRKRGQLLLKPGDGLGGVPGVLVGACGGRMGGAQLGQQLADAIGRGLLLGISFFKRGSGVQWNGKSS